MATDRVTDQPVHRPARACAPYLGPMLTPAPDPDETDKKRELLLVSVGADPTLGTPSKVCLLPVRVDKIKGWVLDETLRDQIEKAERQAGRDPQCIRDFLPTESPDWFTWKLPYWVQERKAETVALLLVYAQSNEMAVVALERDKGVIGRKLLNLPVAGLRVTKKMLGRLFEPKSAKTVFAPPETVVPVPDGTAEILAAAQRALSGMRGDALPLGLLQLPRKPIEHSLCLALGSCQYPHGLLDQIPAVASWHRLNARFYKPHVPENPHPELLVLTGDQVYVDATAGLFDPIQPDDRYRIPYETWLRTGEVKSTMRRLPLLTMLDDHEIDDNWEPMARAPALETDEVDGPREGPARKKKRFHRMYGKRGIEAFLQFQRPLPSSEKRPIDKTPLWFSLKRSGLPIFMLDSRTQRRRRAAEGDPPFMVQQEQWTALCTWLDLSEHKDLPKLIVSPSAILPRHRRSVPARLPLAPLSPVPARGPDDGAALRGDGWSGFPETWLSLLSFIVDRQIQRVVFLSGDEHLGLFSTITLSGPGSKQVRLHSIHSPGLYTPYSFANASPADLVVDETFSFGPTGVAPPPYTCTVSSEVIEGSGFVVVTLERKGGLWNLRTEFDSDPANGRKGQRREFPVCPL